MAFATGSPALGLLTAAGVGMATGMARFYGWNTQVSPEAVLISFGFAAIVGIFFGFYPARRAAQLDPIDALRYE